MFYTSPQSATLETEHYHIDLPFLSVVSTPLSPLPSSFPLFQVLVEAGRFEQLVYSQRPPHRANSEELVYLSSLSILFSLLSPSHILCQIACGLRVFVDSILSVLTAASESSPLSSHWALLQVISSHSPLSPLPSHFTPPSYPFKKI